MSDAQALTFSFQRSRTIALHQRARRQRPPRRTQTARTGIAVITPFKTFAEKITAWRRYRDSVRELSRLSDRELSDIGLMRGDIEFVARQSVAS
jgi:uncharacterized protein YjiS (DUF1127 family)